MNAKEAIIVMSIIIALAVLYLSKLINIEGVAAFITIMMLVWITDIIAERYYLKRLIRLGAITRENALTREQAKMDTGPIVTRALGALVKNGKAVVTEDNRYYIGIKDKSE